MSELINALNRIENFVQYYSQKSDNGLFGLAPGLSQAEIEEIIEQHIKLYNVYYGRDGFSPPLIFSQEIYELYQWHNGESPGVSFINHNYSFWGLKDAIHIIIEQPQLWLFSDEGGHYMVVGSKEKHETSPVYIDSTRHECYSSLTEMMQKIAEVLDITLNLLHERGNFDGDEQERLESWRSIMGYMLDNEDYYHWDLRLLDIGEFLSTALNVYGWMEPRKY